MAEEQIIRLLEEIRDLQKLHVENYKDARKNQRESIELQDRAARRQRTTLLVVGFLFASFLLLLAFSSHH